MVIIPGRNPPDMNISDIFIRFMLEHNFLAHNSLRNHMIIWYEQLAAPPRPTLLGPNPRTDPLPGTESPEQTSPDRILPKSRHYPSGYSVNRCYPLVLLHGLTRPSVMVSSQYFTCSCLLTCQTAFPPFYHVVADQPVRSLDCHLPMCMLACHPASGPIVCLLDSSVVH